MDSKFPEYQRQFMHCLEAFVEQCYKFIEIQEEQKLPQLTEEERAAKVKEITCLISQKEKELLDLQTQRNILNALNTSKKCHPECPASCRSKDEVSEKPTQKSIQDVPASSFVCEPDCPAVCSTSGLSTTQKTSIQFYRR